MCRGCQLIVCLILSSLIIHSSHQVYCRRRHISLANDLSSQAFHCPHAGNPSAGICRDSNVNGYTPYELLRDGQPTRRHFGYCDLAGDDTIAECTTGGITDANIEAALGLIPPTVEVIFLNGNPGITTLPDNLFSGYGFSDKLQAIYVNGCSILSIGDYALYGLPELKIFVSFV